MYRFCLTLLAFIVSSAQASTHVLVSFSMPEQLLREALKDSARFHLPVTLNGLHHNSMPETVKKIMELAQDILEQPSRLIQPRLNGLQLTKCRLWWLRMEIALMWCMGIYRLRKRFQGLSATASVDDENDDLLDGL